MASSNLAPDQKQLLVYATAYRALGGIFILAMAMGMAAIPLQVYSAVDSATDPDFTRRVDESAWMIPTLVGLAALVALMLAWRAIQAFRSSLSLWGLSKYSRPFPIPDRWKIAMGIGHAFFWMALFAVPVGIASLSESTPSTEFYWLGAWAVTVFGSILLALAAAWRARTLLDRVEVIPDLSLIEELP